jgi:hypothetical protein
MCMYTSPWAHMYAHMWVNAHALWLSLSLSLSLSLCVCACVCVVYQGAHPFNFQSHCFFLCRYLPRWLSHLYELYYTCLLLLLLSYGSIWLFYNSILFTSPPRWAHSACFPHQQLLSALGVRSLSAPGHRHSCFLCGPFKVGVPVGGVEGNLAVGLCTLVPLRVMGTLSGHVYWVRAMTRSGLSHQEGAEWQERGLAESPTCQSHRALQPPCY